MHDKWINYSDNENNDFNEGRIIETRNRSLSSNNKMQNPKLKYTTSESYGKPAYEKNRNKEPCNCIGIFGLSKMTNEKTLRNIFEKYGDVVSVKLIMDKNRNESLGFAFVKYEKLEFATKAIEMANEMDVDGKTIRVDYSITQKAHTPTPGQYKGKISTRKNYDDDDDYKRNDIKNNNYKYGQHVKDNFLRNSLEDKRFRKREFRYSDRENLCNENNDKYNSGKSRFDERNYRYNEYSKRDEYSDRNNRFNGRDHRNLERNHQLDGRERCNERSSRFDEFSHDKERRSVYAKDYSCNDRNMAYSEKDSRFDSKRNEHLKSGTSRMGSFDQDRYSEKRNFPRENAKMYYSDKRRFSTDRRSPNNTRECRSRERFSRLHERNDRFREYNNEEINYSNEKFRDRRERFENHPDKRRSRSPVRRESPFKKCYESFRPRKYI